MHAAELLRQYHDSVVRLVIGLHPKIFDRDYDTYNDACKDILAALAQLKKGTP